MPDGSSSKRRGAIDVARAGALVLVVLGHLLLAVIDRGANGAIRGTNLLAVQPSLRWLAMLAPMPVFFAAAGWANATATMRKAIARLRTIIGLGAVVVVAWSAASVVELLVRGRGGIVGDGARISTQPLWFLAAYVPFTAFGASLARLATRPLMTVGACLVVLTTSDIARFAFDAPEVIGWPGFYLAWGVPWLLGAWWRGRCERGPLSEARVGAMLSCVSLGVAAALVRFAGYSPALIDAVKGWRSNTTPPTVFTAVASMLQVGLLMMVARSFDRIAIRWRGLLDRAGSAVVGVYVWHLTALALCAAALAAGLWTPDRFSPAWWIFRPLWFAAVLGVTAALVAATEDLRARLARRDRRPSRRGVARTATLLIGLVMTTAGAALIGVRGPRTMSVAVAATALFTVGWWLLPVAGVTRPDPGARRPRRRGRRRRRSR